MTKSQLLQGALYTGIAALTPVSTQLASDTPLTARSITCLVMGALIAGATALKAWLSTSSASPASDQPSAPAQ